MELTLSKAHKMSLVRNKSAQTVEERRLLHSLTSGAAVVIPARSAQVLKVCE